MARYNFQGKLYFFSVEKVQSWFSARIIRKKALTLDKHCLKYWLRILFLFWLFNI